MVWMNLNWGVRDKTGSHGVPWRTKWKPGAFQFAVLGGLVRFTKSRTPSGQTKPVIFGKFLKKKVGKIIPTPKHLASVASKIYFLFISLTKPKQEFRHCFGVKSGNQNCFCSAKRVAALRDDPCPLAWGSISTPTCSRLRCRPWFDVGWSFIWVWVTVYPLVN